VIAQCGECKKRPRILCWNPN